MSQHWLKPDWEPGLILPQIPIQHFIERNVQALVLDVDGTLLAGKDVTIPEPVRSWAEEAKSNLRLHLLSNNPSSKRIGSVGTQLGLSYSYGAAKPRKASLLKIINSLQIAPSHIAIIGDRIFTDVLVGNRLGLYTVLVRPLIENGKPSNSNLIQRLEQKVASLLGA